MNEVVFIEFIFVRLLRIKLELELGNKMDVYMYLRVSFKNILFRYQLFIF
jgi:hypothetical protein